MKKYNVQVFVNVSIHFPSVSGASAYLGSTLDKSMNV